MLPRGHLRGVVTNGKLEAVPSSPPAQAAGLVDHFFRREYARLVARLVRRYGPARLEIVEDAVQGALAAALSTWAARGNPDNPSAWLARVAENRVRDQLRRHATAVAAEPRLAAEAPPQAQDPATGGFSDEFSEDQLKMMFVCCNDALSPRMQLVLSLKLLCGFSTREIAARLFVTEANVQKLLFRGRERLREIGRSTGLDAWVAPPPELLKKRVHSVLRVLYLLFNEGYSSQQSDQVIRPELCEEALRLAQALVTHPLGDVGETWALLALMHFHVARLDARLDPSGGLLMLEEQDRSRWDQAQIRLGIECLLRSGKSDRFSRFHAEAAVLMHHCTAESYAQTRWDQIVDLYEMLERQQPSPLHTLNRAIALAEWKGPRAGLALLAEITPPTWLQQHYLWDATWGELLRRDGQSARAAKLLERAATAAPTDAERAVFHRRLALIPDEG